MQPAAASLLRAELQGRQRATEQAQVACLLVPLAELRVAWEEGRKRRGRGQLVWLRLEPVLGLALAPELPQLQAGVPWQR